MTTDLAHIPNATELESESAGIVAKAESFVIHSDESYSKANELRAEIRQRREQLEGVFNELCDKAYKAHKSVCAARTKHVGPWKRAEGAMKDKMAAYHREQEQIAAAKRAALQAEARKNEEERRLAEAEQLEAEGRDGEAEQLLDEPITTIVAPVKVAPKLDGVKMSKHYSYEVVDADAIPRAYLKVNDTLIGQIVRAQHEAAEKLIPGIKVIITTNVAAGPGWRK